MRRGLLYALISIGALSMLLASVQARETSGHATPIVPPHLSPAPLAHSDMDRRVRHHRHFNGFLPFGFIGGYEEYPVPIGPEIPAVAATPAPPAMPDADRPPCHEVSDAGVVVDRGLGCRRTGH